MMGFKWNEQFDKRVHRSNDYNISSESSTTVTLLLHADWMIVKNASNQDGANSVTAAPCHKIPAEDAGRFENCISQKLFDS